MGLEKCRVCGEICNIFFVWSSSRNFPRNKLFKVMDMTSKGEMKKIYDGERICLSCFNKLKGK